MTGERSSDDRVIAVGPCSVCGALSELTHRKNCTGTLLYGTRTETPRQIDPEAVYRHAIQDVSAEMTKARASAPWEVVRFIDQTIAAIRTFRWACMSGNDSAEPVSSTALLCVCDGPPEKCPCFAAGFERGVAYEDPEQRRPTAQDRPDEHGIPRGRCKFAAASDRHPQCPEPCALRCGHDNPCFCVEHATHGQWMRASSPGLVEAARLVARKIRSWAQAGIPIDAVGQAWMLDHLERAIEETVTEEQRRESPTPAYSAKATADDERRAERWLVGTRDTRESDVADLADTLAAVRGEGWERGYTDGSTEMHHKQAELRTKVRLQRTVIDAAMAMYAACPADPDLTTKYEAAVDAFIDALASVGLRLPAPCASPPAPGDCRTCEGQGFYMVNAHGPQEVKCEDCAGTGDKSKASADSSSAATPDEHAPDDAERAKSLAIRWGHGLTRQSEILQLLSEVRADERERITRGLYERQKVLEARPKAGDVYAGHQVWQAATDIEAGRAEWAVMAKATADKRSADK